MPTLADRARNAFPRLILASPLHPLMSRRFALITFTGRKSGTRYTTPIGYVREGDRVMLSTDSRWWRNLAEPAPVELRLRGRRVTGVGHARRDPDEAAAIVRRLVDGIPSYWRPAHLAREDGRVTDAEIRRAVSADRVAIVVDLGATAPRTE